jgi:ribosomal protein L11 methyltransferase
MRFLDAGTGTGILAIAARKFGVGEIDAFDIDAASVESARSNAALNGCASMRIVESGIDGFPGGSYHLVTANLLTDVIVKNADRLCGFVGTGGHMIASGISDMRREEALGVFLSRGLSLRHSMNDGGWNCFFLNHVG